MTKPPYSDLVGRQGVFTYFGERGWAVVPGSRACGFSPRRCKTRTMDISAACWRRAEPSFAVPCRAERPSTCHTHHASHSAADLSGCLDGSSSHCDKHTCASTHTHTRARLNMENTWAPRMFHPKPTNTHTHTPIHTHKDTLTHAKTHSHTQRQGGSEWVLSG